MYLWSQGSMHRELIKLRIDYRLSQKPMELRANFSKLIKISIVFNYLKKKCDTYCICDNKISKYSKDKIYFHILDIKNHRSINHYIFEKKG